MGMRAVPIEPRHVLLQMIVPATIVRLSLPEQTVRVQTVPLPVDLILPAEIKRAEPIELFLRSLQLERVQDRVVTQDVHRQELPVAGLQDRP